MDSARRIPDPPTRPFTEYHVFSQLERNYILQTASDDQREITRDFREIDDDAALRPARYQGIILPKNWQRKGMSLPASQIPSPSLPRLTRRLPSLASNQTGSRAKKRSQRSSHGIISFLELSKMISKRWKEADIETRSFCRVVAEKELENYRGEMKAYVEKYGEDALKVAKQGKKSKKRAKKTNPYNGLASEGKSFGGVSSQEQFLQFELAQERAAAAQELAMRQEALQRQFTMLKNSLAQQGMLFPPEPYHPSSRPDQGSQHHHCLRPGPSALGDSLCSGETMPTPINDTYAAQEEQDQFEDCQIEGPGGIRPKSPDRVQEHNDDQERLSCISPLPVYDSNPGINELAQIFVSDFGQFLRKDHLVQQEAESAKLQAASVPDPIDLEKQALADALDLNTQPLKFTGTHRDYQVPLNDTPGYEGLSKTTKTNNRSFSPMFDLISTEFDTGKEQLRIQDPFSQCLFNGMFE